MSIYRCMFGDIEMHGITLLMIYQGYNKLFKAEKVHTQQPTIKNPRLIEDVTCY